MPKRILLLGLVLLLASCQGVVRRDFDETGAATDLKIGDPALKAMVKIVQSSSEYVDGLLTVKIMIHNRTQFRRELEWKVVFNDAGGFPIDDPWGWRPLNLEPKSNEVITAKALSKEATTFQLQLQRASMEDLR